MKNITRRPIDFAIQQEMAILKAKHSESGYTSDPVVLENVARFIVKRQKEQAQREALLRRKGWSNDTMKTVLQGWQVSPDDNNLIVVPKPNL